MTEKGKMDERNQEKPELCYICLGTGIVLDWTFDGDAGPDMGKPCPCGCPAPPDPDAGRDERR